MGKTKRLKENTKQDLSIVQIVYNEEMLTTLPWTRSVQNDNTRFNQSLRISTTGIEGLLWSRKNNITQIQKYKNINIKDTKLKANTKPPRIINC